MTYEVVVVGGGIGGLTVAALLAARGVNVCLLEKEDTTGGCAANYSIGGYSFEGGAGLYSSWGAGELHENIFAELKLSLPEARLCEPAYVVRRPDGPEIAIGTDREQFEGNLASAFPECAPEAIAFYRELGSIDSAIRNAATRLPDLRNSSSLQRRRALGLFQGRGVTASQDDTVARHLPAVSPRFLRFLDAQLQMFGQCSSEECAYLFAAVALMLPSHGLYALRGGGSALAQALTGSIKRSGGTVRPNTPVLRLAYGPDGKVAGVDLLSGETLYAETAVVSNLTVWDTYGKLVGASQTPAQIREQLRGTHSQGAYVLYLGMEEAAAQRLPADHILAVTDSKAPPSDGPTSSPFMFAATPAWDTRAPEGKRAVTVWTQTDTEQWFSFHENEKQIEDQDQETLERWWPKIHACLPELGSGIEVIETASPLSYYERTRRRLGMVGGVAQFPSVFGTNSFSHRSALPGLYTVGDTIFPGQGVAAVSYSARLLADELAPAG
ncbi:MAG: NAD(P)/FAD-dependent oxidoreductase [Pyrinomonadaceae bacterium]